MKRHFSKLTPSEATPDPAESAPRREPDVVPPEEALDDERSQFTRRLESFGLGERQSPLLTDCIWSLDAEGNLR